MSADYVYQILWAQVCLKIAPHQSWRVCSIQRQNCVIFRVRFERRKIDKKKLTYMKTETCKLYYRLVFWIFLPNIIKITLYTFELYRFKVSTFLKHSVYVSWVALRPSLWHVIGRRRQTDGQTYSDRCWLRPPSGWPLNKRLHRQKLPLAGHS